MPSSPVDQLAQALDDTGQLIAAVTDDQWTLPTPCADWTVADLVHHLVAGNRLFARILGGGSTTSPDRLDTGDVPTDQLTAAYRDSGNALFAAFDSPGAMERVVTVPFGSVPGVVAVHLRLVEALVHGWDLAQATGQPIRFPEEVAEQELQFTRATLGDVPPERSPFGPPQPVADDRPAIDRLAACLGRSVGELPADSG